MAKAIAVTLCHGCKNELPSPIPEKCPSCGRALEKPDNPYFLSVDYFVLQLEEHKERLLLGAEEKPPLPEDIKEWEEIQKSFIGWLRGCPFEDKVFALQDVEFLMQQLIYGRHSVDQLRVLTGLGKQIGQQAEAIEKYFAAGGQLYDKESGRLPPKPGSISGGKEATSK